MKRIYLVLFAAFVGLGLTVPDAEARRLGGGGSFGMKRDSTVMKRDATPAAPTQGSTATTTPASPAAAAAQTTGARKWLGPIAGLAAGLGIAALLSHFGLGEEMAALLMIALLAVAAVAVFKLLFRKRAPANAMQYAGAGNVGRVEPAHFEPVGGNVGSGGTAASVPAGFDVEGFLRQAKLNYIRLQAANDRGDMDDIRNFTSPELFAEIRMQYVERGSTQQETDVQQLDASLLDVSEDNGRYVASVRFFGRIREEAGGAVQPLDEVWHLSKPVDGNGGWVIAGIQQFE